MELIFSISLVFPIFVRVSQVLVLLFETVAEVQDKFIAITPLTSYHSRYVTVLLIKQAGASSRPQRPSFEFFLLICVFRDSARESSFQALPK